MASEDEDPASSASRWWRTADLEAAAAAVAALDQPYSSVVDAAEAAASASDGVAALDGGRARAGRCAVDFGAERVCLPMPPTACGRSPCRSWGTDGTVEYAEAIRWLDDRIDLEKTISPGRSGPPTLDRMRELCGLLGDPQTTFPSLHLTGTNGKTSTARILTRLLEVAGLTVGTYTSPHLEAITERISRNDEPISQEEFASAIEGVAGVADLMSARPSHFEVLTAAAFRWFADVAVHAAVVEVGLLGTWDATNVIDGQVAVVTNVGADHLDYVDGSIERIAEEKAGIVKPGRIFLCGETSPDLLPFFESTPAEATWWRGEDFAVVDNLLAVGGRLVTLRTPTSMYEDVFLRLHGAYQAENASIALAACEAFLGGPLDGDLVTEALTPCGRRVGSR